MGMIAVCVGMISFPRTYSHRYHPATCLFLSVSVVAGLSFKFQSDFFPSVVHPANHRTRSNRFNVCSINS